MKQLLHMNVLLFFGRSQKYVIFRHYYLRFLLCFLAGPSSHLKLLEERPLGLSEGGQTCEQQLHHVRQTVLNRHSEGGEQCEQQLHHVRQTVLNRHHEGGEQCEQQLHHVRQTVLNRHSEGGEQCEQQLHSVCQTVLNRHH